MLYKPEFQPDDYILNMKESLSDEEKRCLEYCFNQIASLRSTRHELSNNVNGFDSRIKELENMIEGVNGTLKELIEALKPITESRYEARGAIKLAKFIGFGFIGSAFIGTIMYVLHLLKGN